MALEKLNKYLSDINIFKFNDDTLCKIKEILSDIKLIDYSDYIKFSDVSYKKNYVLTNINFDIVIICWKKGQSTRIHDHPDNCCLVKLLEGHLIEEEYNSDLVLINTNHLEPNQYANKKGKEILHKIIPDVDSISIHIYVPGMYKPNYY